MPLLLHSEISHFLRQRFLFQSANLPGLVVQLVQMEYNYILWLPTPAVDLGDRENGPSKELLLKRRTTHFLPIMLNCHCGPLLPKAGPVTARCRCQSVQVCCLTIRIFTQKDPRLSVKIRVFSFGNEYTYPRWGLGWGGGAW